MSRRVTRWSESFAILIGRHAEGAVVLQEVFAKNDGSTSHDGSRHGSSYGGGVGGKEDKEISYQRFHKLRKTSRHRRDQRPSQRQL